MLPILKPRSTDLRELMEIQRRVSQMVRVENGFGKLERVAGCDVSFARGERAWAASFRESPLASRASLSLTPSSHTRLF
jgi:deoxyinosine 3'endonuclease (endonuclease V)